MKKTELLESVLSGDHLLVGPYQDFEVRESLSKDKPGQYNVIQTTFVLCGREVLPVESFLPTGTRKAGVIPPAFKKGQNVVVRWTGYEKNRFGLRVRGTVETLES